ncbi:MAG TPA: signal peptide peptidase SppA [Phycisphaerae bacterium]|nr:signal peptide peptidase SppA [Phycisphaerae bacterium]
MFRRAIVCCIAAVVGLGLSRPASADEKEVVAVFKLKGPLQEAPDMFGMGELFGDKAPTNMFDLLERLKSARSDENVRAVVLDIEDAQLGSAQIEELRTQIEALKAAEKDVWIFCETLHPGTLRLGSAASKLVLLPTGEVSFHGMYGESMYFKNLLDKIGCSADILHCGAYKSAGEPFYLTGPSKEAEEQTNRLLDGIFEELVNDIAKSRKLTADKVRELIDVASFSAQEALDAKLVDATMYKEDFLKKLRKNYSDAKIDSTYGRKKGPELDLENPFAFFKLLGELMKEKKAPDKPAIAVVYVEGPISGGEAEPSLFGGSTGAHSDTIRKAIAQATADKKVKALILRVDSPGGSAIASDVICEATKRFKKTGRPFVVSMGNVAGSGGYYVSCLGDTIFAEPNTITGSIGVVGGKMVTKGVWDWLGISMHEYKRGRHADIMNTNRRFSDDERQVVMRMMNRVYDEFKSRVVEGRGKKIKGELEPLAGGRVYTGKQALDIGLVDKLGGFADAIKHTASEADLGTDYELRVFPKPRNFMDILAEAFGKKDKDDDDVSSSVSVGKLARGLADHPAIADGLKALEKIDPAKARLAQRFLIEVELLSREGVLMIGPDANLSIP